MKQRPHKESHPAFGQVCSLFETHPEPVYIIDPDGIVLDANPGMAGHFGKSLRKCIGANIYDLLDASNLYPKGSGLRCKTEVQTVLRTGAPLTVEEVLDDRVLRRDLYAVHAENSSSAQLLVISRNVTEEKRAELASAEILERTNAALEQVSTAILDLSLQSGKVVRSPGHDRLFGYEPNMVEWTEQTFLAHVIEEDQPRCIEFIRERNASSKNTLRNEFRIRRVDGSMRWLSTTWSARIDESGAPVSWCGMVQDVTDKKKTEQRYQEMLQQWNYTLESCHIGAWDEDFLNGVCRNSLEHSRIFGYDALLPDWNFQRFIEHVMPEDRAALEQLYQMLRTTLDHFDVEYRIRRKNDEQIRYLSDTGVVIRDEQGKLVRLMGVTRDITEQKERECELKKYKAEMEFALENAHIGVWSLDLKTLSVTMSIEQARILGYDSIPHDWNYNKALARHILPEDHARIEQLLHEAIEQRMPLELECRLRRADGQIRWLSMRGAHQFTPDGQIDRMLGIATDITARKLAEIELDGKRQQLKQALAATRAVVWSWDMKTDQVSCSDEFWAMTGYSANENPASLAFFVDHIHPEDRGRVIQTAKSALHTESDIRDMEHRLCRADGSYLWLTTRGTPQRDDSGKIVRYIGTSIDITERKHEEQVRENLQQQLLQSQKMELIGRLAGGIAHDFNNILAIILGNTELMLTSPKTNPESFDKLEAIENAVERSVTIVQQLLGFARKQKMEPSALCADTELENLLPMLRQLLRENIQLEQQLESFPAKVFFDPGQLFQIITNLVINARDAIDNTGVITIATRTVKIGKAMPGERLDLPAGKYVKISVTDTGAGIDAMNLPHIFEPFYTTKAFGKGAGLGLATVYGIVRQNGGSIECHSKPGAGARFDILLPVHATEQERDKMNKDKGLGNEARPTILVVEDEPQLITLVTEILKAQGFNLLKAADAEQALRFTPEQLARVDLLLTDVMLPGLNGIELSHALRTNLPELPIILMSGYAAPLYTNPEQIPGNTSYLQKPFSVSELLKLVNRMIAKV
jgi:PAS domain S-box-containing protein